ncbi:type II secretion system secretin GspD [Tateyamaria sp. SN3-11]|uniref:type II secretion system secretin GspD n=1 Tax=Tateyamaria sp. SN3-11 TaxID=3092147 RepID=UPI0039EC43EF
MRIKLWIFAALFVLAGTLQGKAQIALDMRDANLRDFVTIVAQATGRNFILDNRVQGTVTVIAPDTVSPDAVYEIFLHVLELNQLTIVEGSETDRIVPLGVASQLTPHNRAATLGGAFETRVITVNNAPLNELVEVIRPLLPAEASLSTVPATGQLILSDRRENINRIMRLVARLDAPRQSQIETIRVRNGSAPDILATIQALDITPPGSSMSADARANTLIVSGSSDFRQRVREVVDRLDTPQRSITTYVVRLNYADASDLEGVIRQSFGGAAPGEGGAAGTTGNVSIVAEPSQNALVITAPSDQMDSIVGSIQALDRRPAQVLIEAVIFELSVENFSDLSVQFGALINDAVVGGVEFSLQGRPTLTGLVSSVLGGQAPGFGSGGTIGAADAEGNGRFAGFLSALTSQSSTRLLSTPSILTLNNQPAEIIVAQNVPFVTGSFAQVGESAVPDQPFQTIQREDVGLTLRVTPQITRDRTVRMEISQEVSNLTNSASAAGSEITSKRQLSTNVLVRDRHVIILGGLLENGSGAVGQKVPGLGDSKLVGWMFRGRNASKSQRVLLVMLRPRIMESDAEATRITRQVANQAKKIAQSTAPLDDGQFPSQVQQGFPFDGADLNQPFDAGFIDGYAREKQLPPLPSRLEFKAN